MIKKNFRTELIKTVESTEPDTSSKYRNFILDYKSGYVKGWERVTQYCSINGVDIHEHKVSDKPAY